MRLLPGARTVPVRSASPVVRLPKLRTTAALFTRCDRGPVAVRWLRRPGLRAGLLPILKALRAALGLALLGALLLSSGARTVPVRSPSPVVRLLKLWTTAALFTCCDRGPVAVL